MLTLFFVGVKKMKLKKFINNLKNKLNEKLIDIQTKPTFFQNLEVGFHFVIIILLTAMSCINNAKSYEFNLTNPTNLPSEPDHVVEETYQKSPTMQSKNMGLSMNEQVTFYKAHYSPAPTSNPKVTEEMPIKLTNEEKLMDIYERYSVTAEEFNYVKSIVLAECNGTYVDAYAVASIFLNRINSYNWTSYLDSIIFEGAGSSIYYHGICDGQFSVYANGRYLLFWDESSSEPYQAVIDCFYSGEVSHNYLSFNYAGSNPPGGEPLTEGGNEFYNPQPEDDKIEQVDVISLTRTK